MTLDNSINQTSQFTPGATAALKTVGVKPADVVELLGTVIAETQAYLVGSLAAGLGNDRSDVDLHTFSAAPEVDDRPMVFFLGETTVDVQHFPEHAPSGLAGRLAAPTVTLAVGACALGPGPDRRTQNRASRWATAVGLRPGALPLLNEQQVAVAAAALVRGAIDDLVLAAAAAELAERAAAPAAPVAWRRVGRMLAEVLARGAGDLFTGRKWTWSRATRSGIPRDVLDTAANLGAVADFAALLDAVSFPPVDALSLVRLVPAAHQTIQIGKQSFALVDGRRAIESPPEVEGPCNAEVERVGPAAVVDAVVEGLATLEIDHDRLDTEIRA